tara:strand:- start:2242 stop:3087 length:846 start_codon:yes stop_codon:yes gene_type:complete
MKNIINFKQMKQKGESIAWITAYDYHTAMAAEKADVDMILVGDSGGMCLLGYSTTNPVTMDEMIMMTRAVRRGAPNTFIVGDMPQGSYEVSDELAVQNAMRFVKEAGVNAIKLEGGRRVAPRVQAIADAGILVIGHLGLTPQSSDSFGGYKVQGRGEEAEAIVKESKDLFNAGISMLLIEAVPEDTGRKIAQEMLIPVMGIGAGSLVDGQLLISHDLLGIYQNFRPKFAKCYIPHCLKVSKTRNRERWQDDGLFYLMVESFKLYVEEVRNKLFPASEHIYQ